ncbi:hypothetical protein KDN24_15945 [Bacillus sp. Bva_UNVM-123]|uniref:hypothetical protein n=1 Tax=Bacillus sp. Bva_UNVM-123 TaxID=2829798 RepID=UPI00391F5305
MNHSMIDFNRISQVLTNTLELVKAEASSSAIALTQLENAQNELQQAMSFSFLLKYK